MGWIPGWDSVAAAGWWSGFYFWISIACLIGLGVAEIASHRYGDRKDELTAIEQDDKDKRHDEDMTRVQHDTAQTNKRAAELEKQASEARAAIAGADARAAEANQKALEAQLALERIKLPRGLTAAQETAILSVLRPFAGQLYNLGVATGDEPLQFMCRLAGILDSAGWVRTEPTADIIISTQCGKASQSHVSGVKLYISVKKEAELTNATVVLLTALRSAGIATDAIKADDPSLDKQPTAIQVAVGIKPFER